MKNQIYLGLLVLFCTNTFASSSNIANTDFRQGNLAVTYTAGNSITLVMTLEILFLRQMLRE